MSDRAILTPGADGFVRKKWSVEECRFLVENGLLAPEKFELIEGEIVFKMGQGRLHVAVVTQILAILSALFGIEAIQSQAQIGIGERDPYNDPEPDVAVLQGKVRDYLDREPAPATEVLLVVEAANTTLPGDSTTKAQLYARHGVPEYWIVAIPHRELIVCRQPTAHGYADIRTYRESEEVAPLARPDVPVSVASLCP